MKFEHTETFNWEGAIRGMRNPLESWNKSDSYWKNPVTYIVGDNDLDLMKRLIKAGTEHRKFLRQVFVSVDITAPLYVWKEADTYKVGTVSNSTSTMHKLASKPITLDCFEIDDYDENLYIETPTGHTHVGIVFEDYINRLEQLRQMYNSTGDKGYWKELVRLLPESWLQTRTITMNYEVVWNMYQQRKNHKLTEWKAFCDWAESLPYFRELFLEG